MQWKRTTIGLALALLGLAGLGQSQEREPALPPPTTVDEAIERLPPIGTQALWNPARRDVDLDPAVAWMRDFLAKDGVLTDDQWRRALQRSRAIRMRERWPVDVPVAVSVEVPCWLPRTEIRLYTDPNLAPVARGGSLSVARCGNCAAGALARARYQPLTQLDLTTLGVHEMEFGVVVEQGAPFSDRARVLWLGSFTHRVEVFSTLQAALPAEQGQELDVGIRKLLEASLDDAHLAVHGDLARASKLTNTAVSLELTLFEGDTPRETRTLLVLPRPGLVDQAVSWELPAVPESSRWSIHVRGSPKDVLKNWDATRYWDGELVIPLSEVPRSR